jgi:putative membrane-bound dehydrogenase-like protein
LIFASSSLAVAAEVELGGRTFTVPDGFVLERVAGPPLVDRPICASFDEQGRLYVADSSGSNDPVSVQLKERPHRIVRLSDSDGDGEFDKRIVFADKMMFPEGCLWHAGSLYVAAPPSIWKLTDTDGDGVVDQRDEWFQGKTLTGCANDLHGPYLGPDGWIYWCKGAFAEQTYERPGRQPLVTRASHIFRRRPSGGPIEHVMTGGMDNPVDVVFTPGGERVFTTTFLQHPGDGKRDGLIHAIYGGVYGKDHSAIANHPRTGPLMPVLTHLGAAAPCGLTRLETDALGGDYQDNILACLFNMRKVTRHQVRHDGARLVSRDSDFVVCDDLDFHPTDVVEAADGSVLIVDTGGWYKLCCPTSQLWKPDVLGAIYRVRRLVSHPGPDPLGLQLDWADASSEDLARRLADRRPDVRRRAQRLLADRRAVPALRAALRGDNSAVRLHAVWTLARIETAAARAATREALNDEAASVRHAALNTVSLHRDKLALDALISMLESKSEVDCRIAAEALGRIGDRRAVAPLLKSAARASDRVLHHAMTFALIEINDAEQTTAGLASANVNTRRAAMLSLAAMTPPALDPKKLPRAIDSDGAEAETAWWLVSQHPSWASHCAPYFERRIAAELSRESRASLVSRLREFGSDPKVQQVIASALESDRDASRLIALEAMWNSRAAGLPSAWREGLRKALAGDGPIRRAAITATRSLTKGKPPTGVADDLRRVVADADVADGARLESLAALPSGEQLEPSVVAFLLDRLPVGRPVLDRALAVDALLAAKLNDQQRIQIARQLPRTGPMELKRLIDVFGRSKDEKVGIAFVSALGESPSAAAIAGAELRKRVSHFSSDVRRAAEPVVARLDDERRLQREKLETVLKLMDETDVRRGQRVFHSTKTACAACHQMGYLGGRVGPDLTRIGRIRNERDLLEAILFPNVSFVRSYEPTSLVLVDGRIVNGVIRDETATEIVITIDAQKTLRIPSDDIEERRPGTVSIMPQGLDKQLTRQELADLVRFLRESR